MSWSKGLVEWTEGDTAFVSVVFTWHLPDAYMRCVWWRSQGYRVRAGGPAVSLMPDYLRDVAEVGGEVEALPRHNPNAVFTSRGCVKRCPYCAVPTIEGDLRELERWEPKPVVLDNNLLACSRKHFDRVIDSLKGVRGVDFNQGLDVDFLKPYHARRIAELDLAVVRIAWDDVRKEKKVMEAITTLFKAGIPPEKIRCYVLVNTPWDTPDDAMYRCWRLKMLGIWPFPQRFQPLDALRKDSYLSPNWDERFLRYFIWYWSRMNWLRFKDFDPDWRKRRALRQEALARLDL